MQVEVWRRVSGVWRRLATGATASSRCNIVGTGTVPPRPHTLNLTMSGPLVSARITCGSTLVESTAVTLLGIDEWEEAYYDGPTFPRFYIGAGSANEGSVDSGLTSFAFHRRPSDAGSSGACVTCRQYGVDGLVY